ncbi:MAG: uracil-DNA glycosylase [Candidatus Pacebacteria bacterium]|nr:uracil-DNA glycosylase [Candidatus Paceibacterota bacterium]
MKVQIEASWNEVLEKYFKLPEWKLLADFVRKEYQEKTVYPHPKSLFNAFNTTPFNKVKVVIIGQDPYHGKGQAHGLSFSVPPGIPVPPSLKNIYKEIENDVGTKKDFSNGNLIYLAEQGVLLLNSVLTVEEGKAGSHANKGWELFTDEVIKQLSKNRENIVFLLWGNYAKQKGQIIDRNKHLVLESSHPSPLGAHRGFIGCKHFSQANEYLQQWNKEEVNW